MQQPPQAPHDAPAPAGAAWPAARRRLVAAVCLLAYLAAAVLLSATQPPYVAIAGELAGDHWYRIQLREQHVGYMYNTAHRDAAGDWHFETTTHFASRDDLRNTITRYQRFAATPPHHLLEARYSNRQRGQTAKTVIRRTRTGHGEDWRYQAELLRNSTRNEVDLNWRYTLGDFLGFEAWLAGAPRDAGARHLARNLDFERLRVVQRGYRVVDRNATGYLVETNAPFTATQTQLSQRFLPEKMTMSGVFDIRRSTESDAVALTELRNKTNYQFGLNERLENTQQLTRLVLEPSGPVAEAFTGVFELHRSQTPTSPQIRAPENYLGEELRYPVTNSRIQALAQEALQNARRAGDDDLVMAFIEVVQRTLRYAEDRPAGAVLTSLDRGTGECTDFADLLTTIARAANVPSRTVYGLAYKDGVRPTMMFHAWNELYVQGTWQAVDPTWPQRYADLTHIALTDQQAAELMLAHDKQAVEFTVLDTDYAGD